MRFLGRGLAALFAVGACSSWRSPGSCRAEVTVARRRHIAATAGGNLPAPQLDAGWRSGRLDRLDPGDGPELRRAGRGRRQPDGVADEDDPAVGSGSQEIIVQRAEPARWRPSSTSATSARRRRGWRSCARGWHPGHLGPARGHGRLAGPALHGPRYGPLGGRRLRGGARPLKRDGRGRIAEPRTQRPWALGGRADAREEFLGGLTLPLPIMCSAWSARRCSAR